MAARHKKHRASGGSTKGYSASTMDAGGNPAVMREAKERKRGGAVKTLGAIGGGVSRLRLDRPGRKTGGRAGADKSPLSSAAKITSEPSKKNSDM